MNKKTILIGIVMSMFAMGTTFTVFAQVDEMGTETESGPDTSTEVLPSPAPELETPDTNVPETVEPAQEPESMSKSRSTPSAIAEITDLEEQYFLKTGTYLQIFADNTLPESVTGTVAETLGTDISPSAEVHVYDGPRGKGYQVFYTENGVSYSVGYGPEAEDRTYSYEIPGTTASSTTETF